MEIWTKEKGDEAPFRKVNLTDFAGRGKLPEFDDGIRWKWNVDRPPRRRVTSGDATEHPAGGKRGVANPESRKMTRLSSNNGEESIKHKKMRKDEEEEMEEDEDRNEDATEHADADAEADVHEDADATL